MSGSRLVVVMRTSVGRGLGRETTPAGLEPQHAPPDRRDAIAPGGRVFSTPFSAFSRRSGSQRPGTYSRSENIVARLILAPERDSSPRAATTRARLQRLSMGGTGLEPVTPSLSSFGSPNSQKDVCHGRRVAPRITRRDTTEASRDYRYECVRSC